MTTAQTPSGGDSSSPKESEAYKDFHRRLHPHNCISFSNSSFYSKIQTIYEAMDDENKFFLSCIAMLSENEVVKRRLLTNWWVGEEKLLKKTASTEEKTPEEKETDEKTPEELVDEILDKFREKGLIEPAEKLGKGRVKNYRMHPLVRSAVIALSGNKFFVFNNDGILTANISESNRACIIKYQPENRPENWKMENIDTIFNVSEPFPDLNLQQLTKKKDSILGGEWLSRMKNVKVLYLGRWLRSPAYHIEVESDDFLSGLKSMKGLRLLSLQGISNISKIPNAIGRLKNLIIMDVKECHNLEALPNDVSLLHNLTYLDVSNCHILDRMPKGISSLSKLQVFKGFVIAAEPSSDSGGALAELAGLKELWKLSIIANSNHFPTVTDLDTLHGLPKLRNLAIAWESKQGSHGTKGLTSVDQTSQALLPPKDLEKLGLQGFPKPKMPYWLVGASKSLCPEKLYIKGGMLKTLGNEPQESVKTLCLKFLSDLKTDWKELQDKFPSMVYLEKVKCPRVTLCPCDEDGVWVKPPTN
ncbi:hypothetical protein I3843_11G069900 [Carya illinoinensis]|uniref:Disease resistance R13L4/SHOC-2-like LRR domain-containing protein n=1 Tax=Carya illinoinensis TaxID=32201 RepID=A0A8T1NWU2_CARIL|nr:disease resistance RPP13-like protein 4 [Carya illinoinensis]KAG6636039.1 hypothetical protein CIPAW_11G083200 [Carya illinoinensis]KAG6687415.1 hypothetical protein I3842_11G070200 [Carya illinoinensis]KAG7955402.1 hypothetical protein I3843_11G069900 [Carya illinoinensis]